MRAGCSPSSLMQASPLKPILHSKLAAHKQASACVTLRTRRPRRRWRRQSSLSGCRAQVEADLHSSLPPPETSSPGRSVMVGLLRPHPPTPPLPASTYRPPRSLDRPRCVQQPRSLDDEYPQNARPYFRRRMSTYCRDCQATPAALSAPALHALHCQPDTQRPGLTHACASRRRRRCAQRTKRRAAPPSPARSPRCARAARRPTLPTRQGPFAGALHQVGGRWGAPSMTGDVEATGSAACKCQYRTAGCGGSITRRGREPPGAPC
jgi:hypothetical protein